MRCFCFARCVLLAFSLHVAVGCVSPRVRLSTVRWNLESQSNASSCGQYTLLSLASRKNEELSRLMESQPAPRPSDLIGTWYGVNKGIGPALAGLHQDVKVFRSQGSTVSGYNIMVEQVSIEDLNCKGWKAKRNPNTGVPKKMGNFIVESCNSHCGRRILRLDYGKAENPLLDPSRHLVDELVTIDGGLLLGRAYIHIGDLEIPVAYFVLSREAGAAECDSYCD